MAVILLFVYLVIGFSYAMRTIPPEMMFDMKYPWLEFTALILLWFPISLIHGVSKLYGKIREFLIYKGII